MRWKHIWHMDMCVYGQNISLWMNECHMNFASSYITSIPIFSNWPSWLHGFFLLKDMYFKLETKGLNDNGYVFTNQFDYTDQFDN